MLYTIEEIKQKICEKPLEVYEIFRNFFGEDFVDIQKLPTQEVIERIIVPAYVKEDDTHYEIPDDRISVLQSYFGKPDIMVYWPEVTITNENDRSIDIKDLYAQITIDYNGRIPYEYRGFKLSRARYSVEQFTSRYVHSHLPSLDSNHPEYFESPCLGTGPIGGTIATLKNGFDEAIWMLFCQELSLYVTVESLRGGPYRKLEEIGSSTEDTSYKLGLCFNEGLKSLVIDNFIKDFVKYYIEHGHLAVSFVNGQFVLGMQTYDAVIDMSNSFIDYFNSLKDSDITINDLFRWNILNERFIMNRKFYEPKLRTMSFGYSSYNGRFLWKFKGHDVNLQIDEDTDTDEQPSSIVLTSKMFNSLIKAIFDIINYRFKNDTRNQETSSAYQRAIYI